MADVLTVEPSARRSWLGPSAGRRAGTALVAGAIGLGGFVGSLLLSWVRSSLEFTISSDIGEEVDTYAIPDRSLSVISSPFNVAYQLGLVALLVLLAAVVGRPDLAARLRLAATGLGLGVGGLVFAVTVSLKGVPPNLIPYELTNASHSYEPGLFCAVGAIVALVAGVWLAAVPARGAVPGEVAVPAAPRPPSALARLVGGQGPAVAFFAGIAGVGGFVASLLLGWLRIRERQDDGFNEFFLGDQVLTLGIGDVTTSTVYQLGVLALVALAGAAAARPALAARLRPGAVGLGLGLAAVVGAAVALDRGWLAQTFSQALFIVNGSDIDELLSAMELTRLPGGYVALGTVVVLTAGVWAAGAGVAGPAAVASPAVVAASYPAAPSQIPAGYVLVPAYPMPVSAAPAATPAAPGPVADPAGTTAAPAANPYASPQVSGPAANWSRPVGYADGLSVSTSESVDIGTQSDVLRN